jgi:hypothetical protein
MSSVSRSPDLPPEIRLCRPAAAACAKNAAALVDRSHIQKLALEGGVEAELFQS